MTTTDILPIVTLLLKREEIEMERHHANMLGLKLFLLTIAGCTTMNKAVDASSTLASSLYAPAQYVDQGYRTRLGNLKRSGAMSDGEHAFISDYIDRINQNYNVYVTNLTSGKASTNIVYDSVNLGLTGGAAIATPASVKTGLAALSTFFQGQKQSIDKNLFSDQAIFALTSIMEIRRTEVLGRIRQSLLRTDYTLGSALIDLDEYYRAGTLQNALQASFLNQQRLPGAQGGTSQLIPQQPAPQLPIPEQPAPQQPPPPVLPSSTNPLK